MHLMSCKINAYLSSCLRVNSVIHKGNACNCAHEKNAYETHACETHAYETHTGEKHTEDNSVL